MELAEPQVGTDGRIGLPSRALSRGDKTAPWPIEPGGQQGAIPIPSAAYPSEGPTDGPWGADGIGPLALGFRGQDFLGPFYGRQNATPHAQMGILPVRRFVSSCAAVIAQLIQPKPATTSGTFNNSRDEGAPSSPIPVFRRWVGESFAEPYGVGRVWNLYLAPPDIQKSQQVRKMLAGNAIPRMGSPYQPALTRLPLTPGPGTPAPTVLQMGNTGGGGNPYAGGQTAAWGR